MRVIFFVAGAALGLLVGMSGEIGLASLIERVLRVRLPAGGLLAVPLPLVLAVLTGRLWSRLGPQTPSIVTQICGLLSTLMLCLALMLGFAWLVNPFDAQPPGTIETLLFYAWSLGPLLGLGTALLPARRRVAS